MPEKKDETNEKSVTPEDANAKLEEPEKTSKKLNLMELPKELATRIAKLDGGTEALEAIGRRELMEALSHLRRVNHERTEALCEALTDEEEKKTVRNDETSREVFDICLTLRQRFPFGLKVGSANSSAK
jgi:phage terminase small subunit